MASDTHWFEPIAEAQSSEAHRWLRWPWALYMASREPQRNREYHAQVKKIHALERGLAVDAAEVAGRLYQIRKALRRFIISGQGDRAALYEGIALLQTLAARSVDMRPYDVQLMAVLAMVDGHFVQLAPGEGKTLTIALVAIINAWLGRPCHVMTANSYLAGRDAELMAPLFQACRVSVATLDDEIERDARGPVYAHDVVYGTAQQFLADYLRDQIALGAKLERREIGLAQMRKTPPSIAMRGLGSAIVDEADSILVDEANTPLIISGPRPDPELFEAVRRAHSVVESLKAGRDYRLDRLFRDVQFDEDAWGRLAPQRQAMPGPWRNERRFEHLLKQSVLARDFYRLDEHYIVQDGKVVIVDERTGRQMPNRSWSQGLHQAVECAAGVEMTPPTETVERMSFQNFFCRYARLTGASGTLQNLERELALVYGGAIQRVPTRMALRRVMHPPRVFLCAEDKWEAIAADAERLHRAGRPVLIGTRRVEDSERLQARLAVLGVPAQLLNAKHPADEAQIISLAGRSGQVTVATNMAGRGTDIHIDSGVEAGGGLVVMLCEPHSAARVDWQLYGRTGRQGQAGEVFTYVSAQDSLLLDHLPMAKRWLPRLWTDPRWREKSAGLLIRLAQTRAQHRALRQRQQLNRADRRWREALSFAARR